MKRTKTLLSCIFSLVCELAFIALSGYLGYFFLLIWSFAGSSGEGFKFAIFMVMTGLFIVVGIVDFVLSCVSFSTYSCDGENYQRKKKLLITSAILKFVLGVWAGLFVALTIGGKDNLPILIVSIILGLILIVCGVLVLVDMKQENKRVSSNQTNIVEVTSKSTEEGKQ